MGVFVGVKVGGVDACGLNHSNLCEGFAGDLGGVDALEKEVSYEIQQRRAENGAVRAECGERGGVGDGDSVGQDDVTANAEGRVRAGDCDGVVERGAGGHEGSGGECACGMEFGDGAVDAGGETEVVGVEDEAGGHRFDCSGEPRVDVSVGLVACCPLWLAGLEEARCRSGLRPIWE